MGPFNGVTHGGPPHPQWLDLRMSEVREKLEKSEVNPAPQAPETAAKDMEVETVQKQLLVITAQLGN